ncbi:hypothetical protein LJC64_01970 [Ruminococcaceae bacterium OttesenSCG-928-A11]|nr:hypothetical protein [Ruminococcaceae bacterium OttesenSCG-928-A11]
MKLPSGTEIPAVAGVERLHGPFDAARVKKNPHVLVEKERTQGKIVESLEKAIALSGLQNGMTVSFHHHFRNGDYIVNMVLDKLAEMGFRDLTVAASSLSDCHAPMVEHIKNGVVKRIETSGLRGELGEAVSAGLMDLPVIFRSHGGRAYAIETGELHIDVAFLGVPSCDPFGNGNGYSRDDPHHVICGAMGYAKSDSMYADKTVVITNQLTHYPNTPFAISELGVDYIVQVDEIGDAAGIMKGATRFTQNPKELLIAETCANVINSVGLLQDNFSMQMGSGGASLAVARFIREIMLEKGIKARFALGGITGQIAGMHKEGLIHRIPHKPGQKADGCRAGLHLGRGEQRDKQVNGLPGEELLIVGQALGGLLQIPQGVAVGAVQPVGNPVQHRRGGHHAGNGVAHVGEGLVHREHLVHVHQQLLGGGVLVHGVHRGALAEDGVIIRRQAVDEGWVGVEVDHEMGAACKAVGGGAAAVGNQHRLGKKCLPVARGVANLDGAVPQKRHHIADGMHQLLLGGVGV